MKTRGLGESSDSRCPGFPGWVEGEEIKTVSQNTSGYAGRDLEQLQLERG